MANTAKLHQHECWKWNVDSRTCQELILILCSLLKAARESPLYTTILCYLTKVDLLWKNFLLKVPDSLDSWRRRYLAIHVSQSFGVAILPRYKSHPNYFGLPATPCVAYFSEYMYICEPVALLYRQHKLLCPPLPLELSSNLPMVFIAYNMWDDFQWPFFLHGFLCEKKLYLDSSRWASE